MFTSVSSVAAIAMKAPSRSAGAGVRAPLPADRALARVLRAAPASASRRDQRHLAVAGEQPLDLLEADLAAADDHAAPAGQLQAGDVEGRVEHPLHAALVADPPAQLADALLACISLGGHRADRVAVSAQAAGTPRPSARAPRRASASAPWRQARSRSASRAERSRPPRARRARVRRVVGAPPQPARARRIPGDQLLLRARAQPGLARACARARRRRAAPHGPRETIGPGRWSLSHTIPACSSRATRSALVAVGGPDRRARGRSRRRWPARSPRRPSRPPSPPAPGRRRGSRIRRICVRHAADHRRRVEGPRSQPGGLDRAAAVQPRALRDRLLRRAPRRAPARRAEASGPTCTRGSAGSPTRSALRAAHEAARGSARATSRATYTRSIEPRACPAPAQPAHSAPATARGRCASASTSIASLPPSSSVTSFSRETHARATTRPTARRAGEQDLVHRRLRERDAGVGAAVRRSARAPRAGRRARARARSARPRGWPARPA